MTSSAPKDKNSSFLSSSACNNSSSNIKNSYSSSKNSDGKVFVFGPTSIDQKSNDKARLAILLNVLDSANEINGDELEDDGIDTNERMATSWQAAASSNNTNRRSYYISRKTIDGTRALTIFKEKLVKQKWYRNKDEKPHKINGYTTKYAAICDIGCLEEWITDHNNNGKGIKMFIPSKIIPRSKHGSNKRMYQRGKSFYQPGLDDSDISGEDEDDEDDEDGEDPDNLMDTEVEKLKKKCEDTLNNWKKRKSRLKEKIKSDKQFQSKLNYGLTDRDGLLFILRPFEQTLLLDFPEESFLTTAQEEKVRRQALLVLYVFIEIIRNYEEELKLIDTFMKEYDRKNELSCFDEGYNEIEYWQDLCDLIIECKQEKKNYKKYNNIESCFKKVVRNYGIKDVDIKVEILEKKAESIKELRQKLREVNKSIWGTKAELKSRLNGDGNILKLQRIGKVQQNMSVPSAAGGSASTTTPNKFGRPVWSGGYVGYDDGPDDSDDSTYNSEHSSSSDNSIDDYSQILEKNSLTTLRSWYRQFRKNGTFVEDRRGCAERESYLEKYGLVNICRIWLLQQRELSVDLALKGFETLIQNQSPQFFKEIGGEIVDMSAQLEEDRKRILPLSRSTVHIWMLALGCRYEPHKCTYYTDRHEAADTVLDRNTRYIPEIYRLNTRMFNWVSVPLSMASEKALTNRNKHFEYLGIPLDHKMAKLPVATETDPDPLVKIHVDFLAEGAYDAYRRDQMEKFGVPGEMLLTKSQLVELNMPCLYGHDPSVCMCYEPLEQSGQDESNVKQNHQLSRSWSVMEALKLRKKSLGQSCMLSCYCSTMLGFALPCSRESLEKVNEYRRSLNELYKTPDNVDYDPNVYAVYKGHRPPLTETPGIRTLRLIGDVSWKAEDMMKQVQDVIDFYKVLYPRFQILFELDNSSNHLKALDDGLSVTEMNIKWGGKQRKMHSTKLTSNCIGFTHPRYQAGDSQSMVFLPDDPPPFYEAADYPKEDEYYSEESPELPVLRQKDRNKLLEKSLNYETKMSIMSTKEYKDIDTKKYVKREGYVGKAKGIKQVLFERGFWHERMRSQQSEREVLMLTHTGKTDQIVKNEDNMQYTLRNHDDFLKEQTQLQKLVHSQGHILLRSVICSPEFAGNGVEYAWGRLKYNHRKENSYSGPPMNFEALLDRIYSICFDKNILGRQVIWRFQRRVRDYIRLYNEEETVLSHHLIELIRQDNKTHRNVGENSTSSFCREDFFFDDIIVTKYDDKEDEIIRDQIHDLPRSTGQKRVAAKNAEPNNAKKQSSDTQELICERCKKKFKYPKRLQRHSSTCDMTPTTMVVSNQTDTREIDNNEIDTNDNDANEFDTMPSLADKDEVEHDEMKIDEEVTGDADIEVNDDDEAEECFDFPDDFENYQLVTIKSTAQLKKGNFLIFKDSEAANFYNRLPGEAGIVAAERDESSRQRLIMVQYQDGETQYVNPSTMYLCVEKEVKHKELKNYEEESDDESDNESDDADEEVEVGEDEETEEVTVAVITNDDEGDLFSPQNFWNYKPMNFVSLQVGDFVVFKDSNKAFFATQGRRAKCEGKVVELSARGSVKVQFSSREDDFEIIYSSALYKCVF